MEHDRLIRHIFLSLTIKLHVKCQLEKVKFYFSLHNTESTLEKRKYMYIKSVKMITA